jgi:hypothetical protein
VHGRGLKGHPIYIDRPGQITPVDLTAQVELDEVITFHIRAMEELCILKEKINVGKGPEGRIYKHIVILDLDGVGMKHCSKQFYGPLQACINIDQNFYPETLYKMFIVNAGWFFKAIWNICSPWIDPITKQRIDWGLDNVKDYIDPRNLPQFLGGKCQCEGGQCLQVPFYHPDLVEAEPVVEEEVKQAETTGEDGEQTPTPTAE